MTSLTAAKIKDALSQIVGNRSAVEMLRSVIALDRVSSGYLFVGRSGVGKYKSAIAFAQAILGTERTLQPDLLQVEPTFMHEGTLYTMSEAAAKRVPLKSSQIRIEQIRSLSASMQQKPMYGDRIVAVIDRADTLTEAAANALLKTLEEPNGNTIVLVADDLGKVLPTIVSRCQVIPFCRLSATELEAVLDRVCPQALEHPQIVEFAQGSPGAAVRAYRQIQALAEVRPMTGSVVECIQSAKVMQTLELDQQRWLLNWWQVGLWACYQSAEGLRVLEQAKVYLDQHCNPQSVWEFVFLQLRTDVLQWDIPQVGRSANVQESADVPESDVELGESAIELVAVAPQKVKKTKVARTKPAAKVAEAVTHRGLFD